MSRSRHWSSGGWKTGSSSLKSPVGRPWSISSFEALDELVTSVTADRSSCSPVSSGLWWPDTAPVVSSPTGTRPAPKWLPPRPPDIDRHFVIANPSSYLYFDLQRFAGSTLRKLTRSEAEKCRGYDDYKYGLNNRNHFMGDISVEALRRQYAEKNVTYLLGNS